MSRNKRLGDLILHVFLQHRAERQFVIGRWTAQWDAAILGTMNQQITGFHQDDERHWVAELACGHDQHVRHNPPWINRPWVVTSEGRTKAIGRLLKCKKCDTGAPRDREA